VSPAWLERDERQSMSPWRDLLAFGATDFATKATSADMREHHVEVTIRGRWDDVQRYQMIPAKYLSGLKIRVLVVRFRPWPPFRSASYFETQLG
jgi:hypothetical protein